MDLWLRISDGNSGRGFGISGPDVSDRILTGSFTPIPLAPPTVDAPGIDDAAADVYTMTSTFIVPGEYGSRITTFQGGGHVLDQFLAVPQTTVGRQSLHFGPRSIGLARLNGEPLGGMQATVTFSFNRPLTANDIALVFVYLVVGGTEYAGVAVTAPRRA